MFLRGLSCLYWLTYLRNGMYVMYVIYGMYGMCFDCYRDLMENVESISILKKIRF